MTSEPVPRDSNEPVPGDSNEPVPGDSNEIVVISGGVGAAKLLRGLIDVVEPANVTAVVNVADDMVLHGLAISPDIDTVTYTLADAIDPERGWGLRDETWLAMKSLERYGDRNWFSLGDRDLATHMQRTARLAEGATLTEVSAEIAAAWDVGVSILPVSNDPISTFVTREDSGEEIPFQEYFVGLRHDVPISSVRFDSISSSTPTPEVLSAIARADIIVIAPSNPIVSIAPVLEVPGILEAIDARRGPCIAISPIVGGQALKGPAADMLDGLGLACDASGVGELWREVADTLIIDDVDAPLSKAVCELGLTPYVTDTIMATPERRTRLAKTVLSAAQLSKGRSQ